MIYAAIGLLAVCAFLAGFFLQRSIASEAANRRRSKLDDIDDDLVEERQRKRLEQLHDLKRRQDLEWNEKVREMLE